MLVYFEKEPIEPHHMD